MVNNKGICHIVVQQVVPLEQVVPLGRLKTEVQEKLNRHIEEYLPAAIKHTLEKMQKQQ